jgi:hypothetical protein
MSERPILFSSEMVRAILENRKTHTRRVIKPQPDGISNDGIPFIYKNITVVRDDCIEHISHPDGEPNKRFADIIKCPYEIGMKLWVRETFGYGSEPVPFSTAHVVYKADGHFVEPGFWEPSIFMPRWASRIDLLIKDIRVERVQDITYLDAIAEGMDKDWPEKSYRNLWDKLNAKRGYGWDVNPLVWVVEFEVMK